ncbi:GTP pyrophosphokinase family protein [Blautia liquoris]|uniref:GTP pyrophosphokinase family protein n=1 Tax=Blautia liquoris TaxID=2779518 RepID=A0A7M2RF98_9FIRM|nr:GTP pyrophosphokinase family protein [Blautia liquoris]QOV19023.1 GTP pyrophosphokinase family protein [Blautia liquoris]
MSSEETINEVLKAENPEKIMEKMEPFRKMMLQYHCASMEVETKIRVLNEEFKNNFQRNPIETIKSRIKTPFAIVEKMKRKGLELTLENIEENLTDIAGIRVICSFPEDIYNVAQMIEKQDDIRIIKRKDYIQNPKPNGYRSLHLILEVPVFFTEGKKMMKVEVQFRTIAMDFWASLEHKLAYKKDVENYDSISRELKNCAEITSSLDYRMQEIRNQIEQKIE